MILAHRCDRVLSHMNIDPDHYETADLSNTLEPNTQHRLRRAERRLRSLKNKKVRQAKTNRSVPATGLAAKFYGHKRLGRGGMR